MRRSVRRWLLQWRKPKLDPLWLRASSWYDFEGRMRRAIAIDIAVELGEVTRSELLEKQITRPLPTVDPDAPTEQATARHWFYAEDTIADPNATKLALIEV